MKLAKEKITLLRKVVSLLSVLGVSATIVLGVILLNRYLSSPLSHQEITERVHQSSHPRCVKDWLASQLDRKPDALITKFLMESAEQECLSSHRRLERSKLQQEQRAALGIQEDDHEPTNKATQGTNDNE